MNYLLKEANKRYRELVEESLEENIESAEKARFYIEHSTAKYHGDSLDSLYIPKIFTENELNIFKECIQVLYGIFDKVMDKYREDEEFRHLFHFDSRLEELILREKAYPCNIPIARIDIFFNEETGEFKFCEFNTDGSSAMNEDRELNIALKDTYAYQKFLEQYGARSLELFDSWVSEALNIYRTFSNKVEKPKIAIVDFMECATGSEFLIFQEAFQKRGFSCEICEIRELKYRDGGLYSPSGQKIDLIYRRAVTSDIMKHFDEVTDFIQAVKTDCVCLLGDFRTQIVHNKILFKVLKNEMLTGVLTENENEFIRKHLPFTAKMRTEEVDITKVIKEKDQWIIKPEDSYGSRGVYAGNQYSEEEWSTLVHNCLNQNYIIQEFCHPYKTLNIDLYREKQSSFEEFSNLTGLFVYNSKLSGIYSRMSKNEIISSENNEITLPTIIVDSKILAINK